MSPPLVYISSTIPPHFSINQVVLIGYACHFAEYIRQRSGKSNTLNIERKASLVAARYKERISEAKYLEMELKANYRSEYWNGTIVAMAGSSSGHNQILRNLTRILASNLANAKCEQYFSDTRLYSQSCKAYFYPDSQIVCGEARRATTEAETLLNPTVIVEVLSKSTEAVDRGYKFECYRSIASLQVYILIDQYACAVDVHTREPDGTWKTTFLRGTDAVLELIPCGVSFPLSVIYDRVKIIGQKL